MNIPASPRAPDSLPRSISDLIAEGGHALVSDDKRINTNASWDDNIEHLPPHVRSRLMSKHSITFNGRHYERAGYRYDSLADAVRYAKTQYKQGGDDVAPQRRAESVESPNESQFASMTKWGIEFRDGAYHLGSFHYDRCDDAIDYAKLMARLHLKP